ncbi:MAG: hypothetical protein M1816_006494 [Peltula sp. TS41687]|nr:MAG: hypothetical protein M1816_006494 [Peltula sp. TS41687]
MADILLSSVDLLSDHVPLLAKGAEVRELYTLDEGSLLFVASQVLHPQLRHRCIAARGKEYRAKGTVHGIRVRPGMRESEAFDGPLMYAEHEGGGGGEG